MPLFRSKSMQDEYFKSHLVGDKQLKKKSSRNKTNITIVDTYLMIEKNNVSLLLNIPLGAEKCEVASYNGAMYLHFGRYQEYIEDEIIGVYKFVNNEEYENENMKIYELYIEKDNITCSIYFTKKEIIKMANHLNKHFQK